MERISQKGLLPKELPLSSSSIKDQSVSKAPAWPVDFSEDQVDAKEQAELDQEMVLVQQEHQKRMGKVPSP